ncbi:hypothetical protein M9H77_35457 [Catharanthus roseus]|uniref:Uncharacterized protein n=1 Tax=Catharanthus roseus TaxID=4058 RepID=A0ACB9ZR88_CATRO|nr:hypothetical protein M9H77_35457 [Catharanthus roseus]
MGLNRKIRFESVRDARPGWAEPTRAGSSDLTTDISSTRLAVSCNCSAPPQLQCVFLSCRRNRPAQKEDILDPTSGIRARKRMQLSGALQRRRRPFGFLDLRESLSSSDPASEVLLTFLFLFFFRNYFVANFSVSLFLENIPKKRKPGLSR